MDPTEIVTIAVLIGALVRAAKPLVSPRWRPFLALALGIVSGTCDSLITGHEWRAALLTGLASSVTAMLGHEAVIEGARGGREIGGPWLPMLTLAASSCSPARTVEASCVVALEQAGESGYRRLCPILGDAVGVVAELEAADRENRDAVIRYDGDVVVVVPAAEVRAVLAAVRARL